MGFFEMLLRA